jgi:GntR family transcriptional regulator
MVTARGDQPKYLQIAADLRQNISSGRYLPDARLPGENELMATYGVARETARKALAQLVNEGLAIPRRGVGVFVRSFRPIVRNGIRRLSSDIWPAGKSIWGDETSGRNLAVDQIQVFEDDAPEHVALLLDLSEDERVTIRSRRYVLDTKPVLLSRSYLPTKIVAGSPITQPDTGSGGTYARLLDLGYPPTKFREDLRARMPDRDEMQNLSLSGGTPVIEIIRTAYTDGCSAVEVNEMIADASAYIFRYDFTTS